MNWGSVYWRTHRQDSRPWVMVTADKYLPRLRRVIAARVTLHSQTNKDIGHIGRVPLGEAAVLYPDVTDANYYPESHQLRFSLVQATHLDTFDKEELKDTAKFRIAHLLPAAYGMPLREELRSAFLGLSKPPRRAPKKYPPWVQTANQGELMRIVDNVHKTSGEYLICSHASAHRFYPMSDVILLRVHDRGAADLHRRYDFGMLRTCNPHFASTLQCENIGNIPDSEMADVVAIILSLIGIDNG